MKTSSNDSNILILEDDAEQMDLLVGFAKNEIVEFMDYAKTHDMQLQNTDNINVIKVRNIKSLQEAVSTNKNVLFALLDCNTPDTEGSAAHDQLVKTNGTVTGQHRAVDIVTEHLPDTPIIIMSSMGRFRRIVKTYYESSHNLSFDFVNKNDPLGIKYNIQQYLRRSLQESD